MHTPKSLFIRYFYLFFIFFFCNFLLFGQSKRDSLISILKTYENNSAKINLLIEIGDRYYSTYPDTSYVYYNEALKLSKTIKDKENEAKSLLSIGEYLNYKEKYKKSLEFYLDAIEINKSINNKEGLANCYTYIGESFAFLNSINKTIEYYFKALNIYIEIDDKEGQAEIYNKFGNLNYLENNYTEAHKYFNKSYEIYRDLNDKDGLATSYVNLGCAISDNGDLNEGIKLFSKSLKLYKELGDIEGVAMNYVNIGDCYTVKEEYDKAIIYMNKAIQIINEFDNKSLLPMAYANLSEIYLNCNDLEKSIYYANKSLEISKQVSSIYKDFNSHFYLSSAYEKKGNYKKAYENQLIYKAYTDSVFNAKKYEQISKLDVLYELENQEKKIELLTEKEVARSTQLKNQKTLSYALITFSLFFLGLIFLLIKQKKERKKAYTLLSIEKEKAQESDSLKSAFLANMSHEIRTPMNAIMGFSGFLKNENLSIEKRNRFVDIINVSGERLMTIINDIIDISKLESNQLKIDLKDVNVVSTLKNIIEIQKKSNQLFNAKNIKLNLNLNNISEEIILKTDENRFVQIVSNLINNAIKFTDVGYVEVGFNLKTYDNKPYVEFYVKDTGCGISKSKFDIIFDRFSQAGKNDFKEGNGLGLSICKGLVALLKGKIWLESEEYKGTTFYFSLPY